jgi:hypothetical protein
MTVKELINELKKHKEDADVLIKAFGGIHFRYSLNEFSVKPVDESFDINHEPTPENVRAVILLGED